MSSRMRPCVFVASAVAASAGMAMSVFAQTAPPTLQTVVNSNDTVPGVPGAVWRTTGAPSAAFQAPSIDSFGNVAFRGSMQTNVGGVTTANADAIYYGGSWSGTGGTGNLNIAVRLSSNALPTNPGPTNGVLSSFGFVTIPLASNGMMAMGGTLAAGANGIVSGTSGNDRIMWTGQNGILSSQPGYTPYGINIQKGQAAPGTTSFFNGTVETFGNPNRIDTQGRYLSFQTLRVSTGDTGANGSNESGIWYGSSAANRALVVRTGTVDPSYDLPVAGSVFGGLGNHYANTNGDIAFGGTLRNSTTTTPNITVNNNEAVFRRNASSGALSRVAWEGAPVPAAGADTQYFVNTGTLFSMFNYSTTGQTLNNNGKFMYSAGLQNITGAATSPVTTSNNQAVFVSDASNNLSVFKRRGDAAPIAGLTVDLNGGQINYTNFRLNNNDQVLWNTNLLGPGVVSASGTAPLNNTALVLSSLSGGDQVIFRRGDAFLNTDRFFGDVGTVLFNNAGQIVFTSVLQNALGTTTGQPTVLMAWDALTGFQKIAQTGDVIDGLTIGGFSFNQSSTGDNGMAAFTDNGWLTFQISVPFVSGQPNRTAVIRTQIIPAPGAGAMALLGLGVMAGRRRRA